MQVMRIQMKKLERIILMENLVMILLIMVIQKRAQGFKRHFAVDSSGSDSKAPSRRQRLNPAPNVKNSGKQRDKSMAGKQQQEHFYEDS